MPNRIYAYTVVGRNAEPWERVDGRERITGTGLIKVGQTTRRTARERIKQQLGTAYPNLEGVEILLDQPATREDGTEFTDREVHAALAANGIKRPGGEWFEARLDEVHAAINTVRSGIPFEPKRTDAYSMRPEQRDAVKRSASYFCAHVGSDQPPKFLWNAKMRFGKTFTAYQFAHGDGLERVLVLTYKPAVADRMAGRPPAPRRLRRLALRRSGHAGRRRRTSCSTGTAPVVWFASFQDLNGKYADGQIKDHNESIHLTDWDCIVLDEYHFGAWRDSARDLYDPTDRKLAEAEEPDEWVTEEDLGLNSAHYLYLSGTPFRAITNGEFTEDQIFNWTYVDEQAAKEGWDPSNGQNPYLDLPRMEMFAYEMALPAQRGGRGRVSSTGSR